MIDLFAVWDDGVHHLCTVEFLLNAAGTCGEMAKVSKA